MGGQKFMFVGQTQSKKRAQIQSVNEQRREATKEEATYVIEWVRAICRVAKETKTNVPPSIYNSLGAFVFYTGCPSTGWASQAAREGGIKEHPISRKYAALKLIDLIDKWTQENLSQEAMEERVGYFLSKVTLTIKTTKEENEKLKRENERQIFGWQSYDNVGIVLEKNGQVKSNKEVWKDLGLDKIEEM